MINKKYFKFSKHIHPCEAKEQQKNTKVTLFSNDKLCLHMLGNMKGIYRASAFR